MHLEDLASPGVALTDAESAAVIELGLRPTYSIVPCANNERNADLMVTNAILRTQAADITGAGRAGRLPHELRGQATALLDEAIPEELGDLERTTHNRDRWRAGDTGPGFPDLGDAATEVLYAQRIAAHGRQLRALRRVAAKIDLSQLAAT